MAPGFVGDAAHVVPPIVYGMIFCDDKTIQWYYPGKMFFLQHPGKKVII